MRLIDADALKETIDREIFRHGTTDHVFQIIDDAPTIEPRRGEWHRSLSDCEEGRVTCNNCGMQFDYYMLDQLGAEIENVYFTNFCPNCGAEMREREGE